MVFIMKLSEEYEAIIARFKRSHDKLFHKVMTKGTVSETIKGQFAYQLEFPLQFLKKHACEFDRSATLEIPDRGKQWPVAVTVRSFEIEDKKRVFLYGDGGWRDFVEQNDVKVGELLIFILVGFSEFRVHRFTRDTRVNDDHQDGSPDESQETVSEEAPDEPLNVTKCVVCGLPPRPHLFLATVRPSNSYDEDSRGAKTRLDAPGIFWQLHRRMLCGDFIHLKGPTNAVMMVKTRQYTHGPHASRVRLEAGWKEFSMANELQLGDQLLFELTGPSCFEVDRMDRIP